MITGNIKIDNRLSLVGLEVISESSSGQPSFEKVVFSGERSAGYNFNNSELLRDQMQSLFGLDAKKLTRLGNEKHLLLNAIAGLHCENPDLDPDRTALFFTCGSELAHAAGQRFSPGIEPNIETRETIDQKTAVEQLDSCLSKMAAYRVNHSLSGNPLAVSLKEAKGLLESGKFDYVIIAGALIREEIDPIVHKAGIKLNTGPSTYGFDDSVNGWIFGQGSAAVLLMRVTQARLEGKKVYAVVDGIGYASKERANQRPHIIPTLVSVETITQSCQRAFENAEINPEKIGYLETFSSGFPPLDTAEIIGLANAYQNPHRKLECALGSNQSTDGYMLSVSGITALIRAALCLYNRFIPPIPRWTGLKRAELFADTPFYVSEQSRTWFQPLAAGKRYAAVNNIGWDGSCTHLILSEETSQPLRVNHFLSYPSVALVPVAASSVADLLDQLSALKGRAALDQNLHDLSRHAFHSYQQASHLFVACIVAKDITEFLKELDYAVRDIPLAVQKKAPWQTPAGSYFTPEPVGPEGKVAFVYPGAFNSYIGLGRDLLTLFPELHEFAQKFSSDPGLTLQERQLYPRSLTPVGKEQLKEYEERLNADPIALISSGAVFAVLYTYILQEIFKVRPDAALGYSLGEIGMLFAMGVWDQADAVSAAFKASPLFHIQLSGPKFAVRRQWSLPLEASGGDSIWENHFLMSPVETVNAALSQEDRVYLTHVNTPRQVVIGGQPDRCERVISSLKCTSLKAPFDFALHCAAIQSEYDAFVEMLTWPVAHTPQTRLYTAAGFEPLTVTSQNVSEKLSRMLCSPLDFVTLVRHVHNDGARIFVELGANANCTKWVEESLKGEAIAAVAVNRKGVEDLSSLVKMLARLVSHRVPLDLAPLYP